MKTKYVVITLFVSTPRDPIFVTVSINFVRELESMGAAHLLIEYIYLSRMRQSLRWMPWGWT